jgi:hypothetical protein
MGGEPAHEPQQEKHDGHDHPDLTLPRAWAMVVVNAAIMVTDFKLGFQTGGSIGMLEEAIHRGGDTSTTLSVALLLTWMKLFPNVPPPFGSYERTKALIGMGASGLQIGGGVSGFIFDGKRLFYSQDVFEPYATIRSALISVSADVVNLYLVGHDPRDMVKQLLSAKSRSHRRAVSDDHGDDHAIKAVIGHIKSDMAISSVAAVLAALWPFAKQGFELLSHQFSPWFHAIGPVISAGRLATRLVPHFNAGILPDFLTAAFGAWNNWKVGKPIWQKSRKALKHINVSTIQHISTDLPSASRRESERTERRRLPWPKKGGITIHIRSPFVVASDSTQGPQIHGTRQEREKAPVGVDEVLAAVLSGYMVKNSASVDVGPAAH